MVKVESKPEDKKIVSWSSTSKGGRFPIFEGEDKEAALKRHLDNLQKSFVKRFNIAKTSFKIREEVVYDAFTKEGIVAGFIGNSIQILTKNGIISKDKNFVFKKSELIGGRHWDGISSSERLELLQKSNVSPDFINSSWYYIPYEVRNVIVQKAQGPAGYEGGGLNTSTSGVFNPVHDDKTVSERIKEESKKPAGKTVGEDSKESSKTPKTVPTSEDTPEKDYQDAKQKREPNTEKAKELSMVD